MALRVPLDEGFHMMGLLRPSDLGSARCGPAKGRSHRGATSKSRSNFSLHPIKRRGVPRSESLVGQIPPVLGAHTSCESHGVTRSQNSRE